MYRCFGLGSIVTLLRGGIFVLPQYVLTIRSVTIEEGGEMYRSEQEKVVLTRGIWKVLSMVFNSVTNLLTLSCLGSFKRATFPLCYSKKFMRML